MLSSSGRSLAARFKDARKKYFEPRKTRMYPWKNRATRQSQTVRPWLYRGARHTFAKSRENAGQTGQVVTHGKKPPQALDVTGEAWQASNMPAARAWTSITGNTSAGKSITVQGSEATRTIHFDPDYFSIGVGTATTPPRVIISAGELISSLEDRVAQLESDVQGLQEWAMQLDDLLTRVVTEDGEVFRLHNPQGQTVITLGQGAGNPALKFYVTTTPASQVSVSLAEVDAPSLATALAQCGIVTTTP